MRSEVTLRPGTPADATACATILADWIEAIDRMPRLRSREDSRATYYDGVLAHRRVTVAEDAQGVQGFLPLDPDKREATSLYAARPGQGIDSLLLRDAQARSDRLWLWTFEANEGARRFYARHGFGEDGRTEGENEESLPDVRLTWVQGGRA